jgi:hypothetical protein
MVGSGRRVAVPALSTGATSTGWDVDAGSACCVGADVDAAGLAQADRNIIIATIRVKCRFTFPLFPDKTKGRT